MARELFSTVQDQRDNVLSNRVADQINQLILDRDLKAGDRLPNEYELCEELNVGRGTLREAVKLLVARNCLEIRRGIGTFVAEKTGQIEDPLGFNYVEDKVQLAKNLMEIRLRLEPWVAALAAERIQEEEKAELINLCNELENEIRNGRDHGPLDKKYHTYIAKCSHNSVMPELIPIITYSVDMFTKLRDPKLLATTIQTHRAIADAICRNDTVSAEKCMREHILANEDGLSQMDTLIAPIRRTDLQ